jgi:hypothetical protein
MKVWIAADWHFGDRQIFLNRNGKPTFLLSSKGGIHNVIGNDDHSVYIQITFRIEKTDNPPWIAKYLFSDGMAAVGMDRADENLKINTGTLVSNLAGQRPLITIKKLKNNLEVILNFRRTVNHGNEGHHIRQFFRSIIMWSCGVFYVEPATWFQQFPRKWMVI